MVLYKGNYHEADLLDRVDVCIDGVFYGGIVTAIFPDAGTVEVRLTDSLLDARAGESPRQIVRMKAHEILFTGRGG